MTKTVSVYVKVEGEASEPDDEGTPGIYLIEVDAKLPAEQRASAALDCFHEHWGIEMLDDFTFTVFDKDGNVLVELDGADSYKLGDRAEFCGALGDDEIPHALMPALIPKRRP